MTIRHTFLAVSAIALLGVSAAQAEAYDGVLLSPQGVSRADVVADAVRTAHAPDQNVVRGSRGAEILAVSRDRETVRAEAERVPGTPDQNVTPGSRVNSRVVSTLPNAAEPRAVRSSAAGSRL